MEEATMETVKEEVLKVEQEELASLRELNQQFQGYKLQLGDLEIKKSLIVTDLNKLRAEFTELENGLMDKYGKDVVINIETGEIKTKENG